MKILFLSCHSVLEADEIKLLQELGHTVYSLHGAYSHGQSDGKRPPLEMNIDKHWHDLAMQCSRENILPELIDNFDVVLVMHRTDWIEYNLEKLKGKKIILRTIGQNSDNNEKDIAKIRKYIKIIRMSPTEKTIPHYQGEDALIRFCKEEDEYNGWIGNIPKAVNISQALFGNDNVHSRGDHMNLDTFKKVMDGFGWKVYGPDNEYAGEHNGGYLNYEDLKNMLRFSRVYFYIGTQPSPYTLGFIEAFMMGIPVVTLGMGLWNTVYTNQKTWEIPQIIENGVNGFYSDSINELRGYIDKLLNDHEFAKKIGEMGRLKAIELFGKSKIKNEWKTFLEKI